jgi:hypothetical protein
MLAASSLLTQKKLAQLIGSSLRTVERHSAQGGVSHETHVHTLAIAVYPTNPQLAAKLAGLVRTDLVQLGPERPKVSPPEQPQPPPSPTPKREHVDSVLCAAADALQTTPASAKPVVAAIFGRALELGVDLSGLARLLANDSGAKAAKAAGPR